MSWKASGRAPSSLLRWCITAESFVGGSRLTASHFLLARNIFKLFHKDGVFRDEARCSHVGKCRTYAYGHHQRDESLTPRCFLQTCERSFFGEIGIAWPSLGHNLVQPFLFLKRTWNQSFHTPSQADQTGGKPRDYFTFLLLRQRKARSDLPAKRAGPGLPP